MVLSLLLLLLLLFVSLLLLSLLLVICAVLLLLLADAVYSRQAFCSFHFKNKLKVRKSELLQAIAFLAQFRLHRGGRLLLPLLQLPHLGHLQL